MRSKRKPKPPFKWARTLKTQCVYDHALRMPMGWFGFKKDAAAFIRNGRLKDCVIVEMRGTYVIPPNKEPRE